MSEKINIMVIFGTRPEAIKMCPLIKLLQKEANMICRVCLTGQHEEMLSQVMDMFGIQEDYNLHIMRKNQTLSQITSNILILLEKILKHEKPDLLLVHGDTTTSYVAALAGFYLQIPIGHVEAGLRTYNIFQPYPEEFNRISIDMIADLFFAPTIKAKQNLLKEGKNQKNIFVTGNTVIDAMYTTISKDFHHELLNWAADSKLILLTAHRRENIGMPMRSIFRAVRRIIKDNSDVKIIYPIHKNPQIREIANEILGNINNICIVEPLNIFEFHNFISKSYLIMTDSGGIQEEAPALGKPVLVMRDVTERPEGVEAGVLKLVGTNEDNIYYETNKLLHDNEAYLRMSKSVNPYGDGHASERIVKIILQYFNMKGKEKDA